MVYSTLLQADLKRELHIPKKSRDPRKKGKMSFSWNVTRIPGPVKSLAIGQRQGGNTCHPTRVIYFTNFIKFIYEKTTFCLFFQDL
jgi:hypothetical protein